MAVSLFPDHFYRAFEDTHRGSRELIRQRLLVYLPFVKPLAMLSPGLPVLDIGCGRGEWLELLNDHGIAARGVDTDDGMLAACLERGLNVVSVDALAHLASLPGGSLLAVTGFHIAEHLPFGTLQSLFAQALRVLVPGGLLILETPNPENLLVGSANFYIDPSHQRPLPSQLLSFLAEHQGFSPVRLLRLQEEERLAHGGAASLYDVLANVSPDYAIVAQVPFPRASSSMEHQSQALQLTRAFDMECGVSLTVLASRYDHQLQLQASSLLQAVQAVERKANQTERQLGQADSQVQQIIADVQQLYRDIGHCNLDIEQMKFQAQQMHAELAAVHAELAAVHTSHSWRITKPLRWLARFFRSGSGKA
jgi:SAM-dependent methyltransferase